jgi:hypothetical protein
MKLQSIPGVMPNDPARAAAEEIAGRLEFATNKPTSVGVSVMAEIIARHTGEDALYKAWHAVSEENRKLREQFEEAASDVGVLNFQNRRLREALEHFAYQVELNGEHEIKCIKQARAALAGKDDE